MKRNLGQHWVMLRKRAWNVYRIVWEIDGKLYIRFDHKMLEVEYDPDDLIKYYVTDY